MTEEDEGLKGQDLCGEVAAKEMEHNGDGDCTGEKLSVDTKLLQDTFNSDLLCDQHGSIFFVLIFFFSSSFFSFVYFCPSTQTDSSDVLPRSCCLIIPMPSHVQGALHIMDVVPKLHVGEVRSLEGYYTEEEKGLLSSHFSGVI